jgi:hypothetical protein
VSFDTFENPAASMFSFTLHVQSDGYARSRATRVFLCASSPDESGRYALDWALESLVQDGDELIVFRGVDPEDLGRWLILHGLLRILNHNLEKDHEVVREEARELMRQIQEKCIEYDPERKVGGRYHYGIRSHCVCCSSPSSSSLLLAKSLQHLNA